MRGIPHQITDWLISRFEKRRTTMAFDDFLSDEFPVENGLDQGDPISQLIYILYNAGLLEIIIGDDGILILIFVDDAVILARAKNFDGPSGTHEILKRVMEQEEGVLKWTRDHNCIFGIAKWQLADYTAKTRPAGADP
ncbi:hypothetical protein BDZ89DRAFT_920162, partial [Hymenopellis radicata]